MFTQLFGHFLLNRNIITAEQLRVALEAKNITKARLGALAIEAGLMTASQVDLVHEEQKRVDKRIGDIAIAMGFLTEQDVEELLAKQKNANVLLGQALIDLGYLTNKQFEDVINEYKEIASFKGDSASGDKALAKDITNIFDLEYDPDKDFYVDYILLLTKNLIRFIGDDFVIAGCTKKSDLECEYITSQELTGDMTAYSAIAGGDAAFINIASRYAVDSSDDEDTAEEYGLFDAVDEFVEACVGEFLNLQNGLFAVNMSNNSNVELDLTPQTVERSTKVNISSGLAVTLQFSFGKVDFIIMRK